MDTLRQNAIYKGTVARFNGKLVQPSFLQSEVALQNGKAAYPFAINQNNGVSLANSEKRLNQNDAFVASHLGIFIKKEDSAKRGSGVLQTYPNSSYLGADEATYFAFADMEAIWNSYLNVKVGDVVFGEAIDMRNCRSVRTTQQTSATTKSEQLSFDGYIPVEPIITFDGANKNELVLNIANWAGQLIQNSTANAGATIYVVLKAFGFLVTGGGHISK